MVVFIWRWAETVGEKCALESLAHFALGVTQPTFKVAQCLLGATLCYHDSLQSSQIRRAWTGHARSHKLCHTKASRIMQAATIGEPFLLQAIAHCDLQYRPTVGQATRAVQITAYRCCRRWVK